MNVLDVPLDELLLAVVLAHAVITAPKAAVRHWAVTRSVFLSVILPVTTVRWAIDAVARARAVRLLAADALALPRRLVAESLRGRSALDRRSR